MVKNSVQTNENTVVVVAEGAADNAFVTFEQALETAGFWNLLHLKCAQCAIAKSEFPILIKPDCTFFDLNAPTATDPALVERLVLLLHQNGYDSVNIGIGPDPADYWLDNRDPVVLAELVGYRFATDAGTSYDIVSLADEVDPAFFPPENILHADGLSSHWTNSPFRINFAKNKTNEAAYFSLGLQNLIGALPKKAGYFHYQHRLRAGDVAVEMLRFAGPDFTIIDAWVSNHGAQGSRAAHPIETRTFIASENLLLADWTAALKMGQDPYACPATAQALREIGLPANFSLIGSLQPYLGWRNVSKSVRESTVRRNESPLMAKLSQAWLQQVNTDIFPFKNSVDEQINRLVAPLVANPDAHPLAQAALIGLNYGLANFFKWQESWKVLFDKDRLYRQTLPLGFDPAQFTAADFEQIENYIVPLAQIARHTPADRNGLKWRYLDDSVIFEFSQVVRVPYASFIEKVDVARAVELMYDNIGGARQTVASDDCGRPLYQAERDLYLPQPNWMVFFGGECIDVQKIEKITYAADRQTIHWRTVGSPNKSADFDDGMVSFSPEGNGTLVSIVARQKFALPLFWQVIDISYFPDIKNALVSDSYIRFFARTMANFEAACEGRDPRIGKVRDLQYGENESSNYSLEIGQFKDLGGLFTGFLSRMSNLQPAAREGILDENGFRHFTAAAPDPAADALRGFARDVASAVKKDILLFTSAPGQK